MSEEYVKPSVIRIDRMEETERLYELEDKRNAAIKACAREWLKIMGKPSEEFWSTAVPQAMFDILDSFDKRAARLAAEAYLELYKTKPTQ